MKKQNKAVNTAYADACAVATVAYTAAMCAAADDYAHAGRVVAYARTAAVEDYAQACRIARAADAYAAYCALPTRR